MKLIIDIPEQIYLNAKADLLCGGDVIVKAIKNGILHETVTEFADRCRECGREKVLDKIKAKIAKRTIEQGFDADEWSISYDELMKIIDKYKAKNKEVER